jgi:1-acyl-sn-glycerol-3-phosphate acyltransferase
VKPPDSPQEPPPDAPRQPPAAHVPLKDLVAEVYTYVGFSAGLVATLPLVTASHLLHRGELPRMPGRWVRRMGRATAAFTPLWDFTIEGTPPADIRTSAYVVVANHLSLADPFLLSGLPWDMLWVGKEELLRLPLIGWIMRLGGDVSLKRGSGESVRAMFEQCRRAIDGDLSVMLFPEGTRATKIGVQPFKDGAFELAIERGVPILPIAIAGTEQCMRKGSGRLGRAKAIARILDREETKGLGPGDLAALRDRTRERIATAAADLERKLGR